MSTELNKTIDPLCYLTPEKTCLYQQEIKRSKFLTWITSVDSPSSAKQWIQSLREQYPDAAHVCWAYIAGAPNSTLKSMSDDGEPSGTAGKPIL
ncbi:MAG: YigZ family protein, partial [Cocleimonas sp.]|nr:YigZ family protein [Cocleimonas sp.]